MNDKKRAIGYMDIFIKEYDISDQELLIKNWCEENNTEIVQIYTECGDVIKNKSYSPLALAKNSIGEDMILIAPTINVFRSNLLDNLTLMENIDSKQGIIQIADSGLNTTDPHGSFLMEMCFSLQEAQQKIRKQTLEKLIILKNKG